METQECCPKFDPAPWDGEEFVWHGKPFIKDNVCQIMHVPLNFGKVIVRMMKTVEQAGAQADEPLMLALDPSPWRCELYMAVKGPVEGAENVALSGTFLTKVFDGPFKDCGKFFAEMQDFARSKGKQPGTIYFYYTTCPKCAKKYGHNYMVGFVQVA